MPKIMKNNERLTDSTEDTFDVYEFNEPDNEVKKGSGKQYKHKPEVVQGVLNLIFKTQQSIQHLREKEYKLLQEDSEQEVTGTVGSKVSALRSTVGSKVSSLKSKKDKTESRHGPGNTNKRVLDVSVSSASCIQLKKLKYKIKTSGSVQDETIGLIDRQSSRRK
ncbi:uncharacterized protein [Ptychodera flava]|uniref:uncharacterized protein isoform X2 n=1 Tax=Ptychodera flava TaxID=63121 RepID=UPI003969EC7A